MLQARFGRGFYTYAAYAFYRQLPAGVEAPIASLPIW